MSRSRKKHAILISVWIIIVMILMIYMKDRDYTGQKSKITVVLPKNSREMIRNVQEGIRDYAYDNQIKLDVWYKEQMSEKELESLIKEERKNQSVGVLLVYPELYLEKTKGKYEYSDVLALTDTMQKDFVQYAAFESVDKETYRLPLDFTVLKQVKQEQKKMIYVENTYKLGYESMRMIAEHGGKKQMSNICLQPVRVDKEVIESGTMDALFED